MHYILSLHSVALVLFAPTEIKVLTHFGERRRVPLTPWSAAVSGTANQDTAACPSPVSLKLPHHHSCPQLHITVVQSSLHLPCILFDTFQYSQISVLRCIPGASDSWIVPLFYHDMYQIDCSVNQELISDILVLFSCCELLNMLYFVRKFRVCRGEEQDVLCDRMEALASWKVVCVEAAAQLGERCQLGPGTWALSLTQRSDTELLCSIRAQR